jgi:hypothetical protein
VNRAPLSLSSIAQPSISPLDAAIVSERATAREHAMLGGVH